MSNKYIVRIQKNGVIKEVEVTASSPREAQEVACRLYPDHKPTNIQWRINPTDGQKILCS